MEKPSSEKFFNGAYQTITGAPCTVVVGRHKYKVRQVAQAVKERIALLEQEAQVLEGRGKQGVSAKEARRITKKLFSLHSKKAAYYLLGNWAIFCPWLWWMKWHVLQLRGNETTFRINEAGVVSADLGFSKANWDISKQERELYMRPVGEVAKQQLERLESVMNMLETDALGIKEESK
jgi:hypothetical protein